jgi:hypothetical protein
MAKIKTVNGIKEHKVVSNKEWLAARKALLVKEKKFNRLRDELNRQRRALPWEKVDKEYVFDGPDGKVTLAGLFGDNSQLIIYHFMFGPGWKLGCPHCSFWCDLEIQPAHSCWIGMVQGICLPFRGFSRSGSTISTGLLLGLPKRKLEEFSFALAVVLTPPVIAKETHRLLKEYALSGHASALHLFAPSLVGMVFSFIAGLLALKWLSRWLEGGRWKLFGFYCLVVAAGVLTIHLILPG